MKIMAPFFAAAVAAFLIGSQQARAASISDCEKIEAWDAYNKCLASYGRKQGTLRVTPDGGSSDAGPRASRRGQAARGGGVVTRRNGRAYAVFDVGAPVKQSPRRRGRR